MPFLSNSSPFDQDVEKATDERNTSEDWAHIMELCDKVQRTNNGAKDCLRSIVKRLNHRIPHVVLQTLTLLDACVNNCGRIFHLEVASRYFISEIRSLLNNKNTHNRTQQTLKQMIKKWSEEEFKGDPALDLIPSFYNSLVKEGFTFAGMEDQVPKPVQPRAPDNPNVAATQQEADDLAKAIELSLKEEKQKKNKSESLYPSFGGGGGATNYSSTANNSKKEIRQVRALYDFEAAEDNELTFKAGEIIGILDDSDPNWWKGQSWRGEGLFPANFVTADLTAEPEEPKKERKSVQFNEVVEVQEVPQVPEQVSIDEGKIDECLSLLQNADPTGETHPDPPELLQLEEHCRSMGPLIDQELERVDRRHMELMKINTGLTDALQMYHSLMRELPAYGYSTMNKYTPAPPAPQQQMMPDPNQYSQQPQQQFQPAQNYSPQHTASYQPSNPPQSLPMGASGYTSMPSAQHYQQGPGGPMSYQPQQQMAPSSAQPLL